MVDKVSEAETEKLAGVLGKLAPEDSQFVLEWAKSFGKRIGEGVRDDVVGQYDVAITEAADEIVAEITAYFRDEKQGFQALLKELKKPGSGAKTFGDIVAASGAWGGGSGSGWDLERK